MKPFCFYDRYGLAELYKNYDQARGEVLAHVGANRGEVVLLDFSGITHLGYSYSKATVCSPIREAIADPKEQTRIVLSVDPGLDLEELEAALEKFAYGVVVMEEPTSEPATGRVLGKVPEHLRSTWQVLAQHAPVSTAQLSERIGESLQNTNQRLRKLDGLGLIRREKVTSASGGIEWESRVF